MYAGVTSVVIAMMTVAVTTDRRRRTPHDPSALESHPLVGACASGLAWMLTGNALAGFSHQWFGAAAGAAFGVVLWVPFYLVTWNNVQHLRTWGATKLAVPVLLFALTLPDPRTSAQIATFALGVCFMVWDTWRRVRRTPRLIEKQYHRSLEIRAILNEQRTLERGAQETGPADEHDNAATARLKLELIDAIESAASGRDFGAEVGDPTSQWRDRAAMPALIWLRAAAAAGRWEFFADATRETRAALKDLERLLERSTSARKQLDDSKAGGRI